MADYPVRAGVFADVNAALSLVNSLRTAGFSWEEVSVITSDDTKEKLFPEKVQQDTSTEHATKALDLAGAGLLGLGGMATVAALVSTAGTALMIMGAFAGLAAAGTFTSLMATRGFESEASDFYDQAVQEGKILVAVDVKGDDAEASRRRDLATELITKAGGETHRLAE
ncbi:hypothetical protein [Planctomicrobium sp. SH664]|uniref:hypothetical protein n=1 Tax=Planctomicrobium sp. SH664 TaxID=3448125 RepID=UPI003F5BCAE3